MYSIIYTSHANSDFNRTAILQMLSCSRETNAQIDITGCLLYHKNQFIQLIEGSKENVTDLYSRICKDSRHHGVQMITQKKIDKPLFKDWSMAFHDFGSEDFSVQFKMSQIDEIFNNSGAFENSSTITLEFFKNVNKLLFGKN